MTVTTLDGSNVAVGGVTVTGLWESSGQGQSGTCPTGVTGTCSIQRTNNNDNDPTESFTVTNLAKNGYTFVGGSQSLEVNCSPPLTATCN